MKTKRLSYLGPLENLQKVSGSQLYILLRDKTGNVGRISQRISATIAENNMPSLKKDRGH